MSVNGGRSAQPKLTISVCGEHGGDEKSIQFLHKTGLDVVSCSALRVLGARLAAAKAAIALPKSNGVKTSSSGPR